MRTNTKADISHVGKEHTLAILLTFHDMQTEQTLEKTTHFHLQRNNTPDQTLAPVKRTDTKADLSRALRREQAVTKLATFHVSREQTVTTHKSREQTLTKLMTCYMQREQTQT